MNNKTIEKEKPQVQSDDIKTGNTEIKDERIELQKIKIKSNAYTILANLILVSVVIQKFFFNAPDEQYMFEFICFIIASIYIVIKNITLGIDTKSNKPQTTTRLLLNSLLLSLVATIVFAFLSGENSKILLIFFIAFMAFTFIGNYLIYYFTKKKQDEIISELDKEE